MLCLKLKLFKYFKYTTNKYVYLQLQIVPTAFLGIAHGPQITV